MLSEFLSLAIFVATGIGASIFSERARSARKRERQRTFSSSDFYRIIHPEDRARVATAVNDAIVGKSSYHVEHRVVWPDASVRWLFTIGSVRRDLTGKVVRMVGCTLDITERKNAELRARAGSAQHQWPGLGPFHRARNRARASRDDSGAQ